MSRVEFNFVCPECRTPLEPSGAEDLRCPADALVFSRRDGVLSLLTDERFESYRRFLEEYRTVRRDEGRGVDERAGYRALPFADLEGHHRAEWRVRAASFDAMMSLVVAPTAEATGRALTIADLGAGNTWMSRRLALAGHHVIAVDLHTDPSDGLGARVFSEYDFSAVQAEFDRLPIPDGVCDLAIFNGAIHYSTDPTTTTAEALRVLRPGGAVVILDTPVYRSADAGREMVADRQEAFRRRFGFASDSIDCRGFLTFAELEDLGRTLGLEWLCHRPYFGLRWGLRPWWAAIRRRREPASFVVSWANKTDDARGAAMEPSGPPDRG
jgi:LSD1 subclass zinc finger protein